MLAILKRVEPEVDRRFQRIEALVHRSDLRSIKRFERAERRMELADARMDRFDKQLQATRDLVRAGVKLVTRLSVEVREVSRTQKAMLRSQGNGHNGFKRSSS